jgi:putative membrane protein
MMFWYDHHQNLGRSLMTFGMVASWGLLVAGVVMLTGFAGSGAPTSRRPPSERTPEHLLAVRFARGDIEETECTGRVTALRGQMRT